MESIYTEGEREEKERGRGRERGDLSQSKVSFIKSLDSLGGIMSSVGRTSGRYI